jgi:hypothetical protein
MTFRDLHWFGCGFCSFCVIAMLDRDGITGWAIVVAGFAAFNAALGYREAVEA